MMQAAEDGPRFDSSEGVNLCRCHRQEKITQAHRNGSRSEIWMTAGQERAMSGQTLLVILLVGLIAGWLAGQIVRGTGYGLIADIALGIVGALIGSWLLPQLHVHLGSGIISAIIGATSGALLLLLILRLVYRGGRW
jgi:uncharacterized membrane protein YeaQ/YmgE (transglycosylase-associated protein family)